MKIAFLGITSNLIRNQDQENIFNFISGQLSKIGEQASLISYFNNSFESLRKIISDNYDMVFCVGTDNMIYNNNIKSNLAKITEDRLIKNEQAILILKRYCESNNMTFGTNEEIESELPSKCIPLIDELSYNNGFLIKYNSTHIAFLPNNLQFAENMYLRYISALITEIADKNKEIVILRCYGISEKDIKTVIEEELNNKDVSIKIINQRLDNIIYIFYSVQNSANIQDVIASICSKLSKFIYATDENDLYNTAINLLKLQGKRVSIAETLTYGKIAYQLLKANSQIIEKSFVFNDFSKILDVFHIDSRTLVTHGNFSVNSVYEFDNALLDATKADISIFVLGQEDSNICYIAIGDIDGIHVYKNKLANFNENTIDTLAETTMFYLIKKLRQNDLHFN